MLSRDDLTLIQDENLQKLVDYWLERREGQLLMPYTALDPIEIEFVLDDVWLCDVESMPRDFRYRLAGDHIRQAGEEKLAGRKLSEVTDRASIPRVIRYFSKAVDEPAIVHVIGKVYSESARPARGERIILPLSGKGDERDTPVRILGATIHTEVGEGDILPQKQTRSFFPVDGRPSWQEDWLESD